MGPSAIKSKSSETYFAENGKHQGLTPFSLKWGEKVFKPAHAAGDEAENSYMGATNKVFMPIGGTDQMTIVKIEYNGNSPNVKTFHFMISPTTRTPIGTKRFKKAFF